MFPPGNSRLITAFDFVFRFFNNQSLFPPKSYPFFEGKQEIFDQYSIDSDHPGIQVLVCILPEVWCLHAFITLASAAQAGAEFR
jgi:hypothetical protein